MTENGFKSRDVAIEDFDRRGNRKDGKRVVPSLNAGLPVLRDLTYERMHADVERIVGLDSMLIPVSELKTAQRAETAIELFAVAESACTARDAGYLGTSDDWYANWLAEMRLGDRLGERENAQQLAAYLSMSEHGRRMALSDVLSVVLPESRQSPLLLLRLVPLAVQIATAVAFNDPKTAARFREVQKELLPVISDCHDCQGNVLANGKVCEVCGNPLWNFEWLTMTD